MTGKGAKDRIIDTSDNPLTLDGKKIKRVDTMRYLGFEISDELNNIKHWNKRKSLAINAVSKLKTQGIVTNQMHPNMKAHLYKTYVRPALTIPRRCRTTSLFLSLNIMPTDYIIKNIRVDFFNRLIENEFTKKMMIELAKQPIPNDFISEILDITRELEEENMSLKDKCKLVKLNNITEYRSNQKNDVKVQKLRDLRQGLST
ncbi:hypothetical protein BpHYR1_008479 [Brachionus plicatilis]|uniref:RNA-directed DNA polymerase from mobile element jockey-like n=1 Tax=Brachionus plicatilis TaxID=10195 RepID=A0A3M7S8H6_BRAPC|nr:hypothetical protein BpHYR1_008479 [Brachionus plicatilis]